MISPSPLGSTASGDRILALDGLRGVAILLVLWWHMYACVDRPPWIHAVPGLEVLTLRGWSGVLLFFVLSGFLLGRILVRHRGEVGYYRTFYIRRTARILPLYYVCFGLYLIARASLDPTNPTIGPLLNNSPLPIWPFACFVQNITMAIHGGGSAWLGVTWSLAVEEQFYLILPLLIAVTARAAVGRLALFFVVLAPLLRFVCLHWSLADPAVPTLLLPTQIDGFALGLLAATLLEGPFKPSPRFVRRTLGFALLVSVALECVTPGTKGWLRSAATAVANTSTETVYVSLILWVATFPLGQVARLLRSPVLVWIGRISYFIYLFHLPAQYFSHWLLRDASPSLQTPAGWITTAVAISATFAGGEFSRRTLEEPLIRWGHRLGRWQSEA